MSFYNLKGLSTTSEASVNVFDTASLNFVTDIHFLVIIHTYSKFVYTNIILLIKDCNYDLLIKDYNYS